MTKFNSVDSDAGITEAQVKRDFELFESLYKGQNDILIAPIEAGGSVEFTESTFEVIKGLSELLKEVAPRLNNLYNVHQCPDKETDRLNFLANSLDSDSTFEQAKVVYETIVVTHFSDLLKSLSLRKSIEELISSGIEVNNMEEVLSIIKEQKLEDSPLNEAQFEEVVKLLVAYHKEELFHESANGLLQDEEFVRISNIIKSLNKLPETSLEDIAFKVLSA